MNTEFALFFLGIALAFFLQVLYDGLGDYPHVTPKFWIGLSMVSILSLFVAIYLLLNLG